MDFLTFDCRGTKITVERSVIDASELLKAYCERVSNKQIKETPETPYIVNCSAETMHKLLDLVPNGTTNDVQVLKIADFLGFEKIMPPLEKEKEKEEIVYMERAAIAHEFISMLSSFNQCDRSVRNCFFGALLNDLHIMKSKVNGFDVLYNAVGSMNNRSNRDDCDYEKSQICQEVEFNKGVFQFIKEYLPKCPFIKTTNQKSDLFYTLAKSMKRPIGTMLDN
jgi:hypothetical protein